MPTSESNQKYQIEAALMDFADQPLAKAATAFFNVLGYASDKTLSIGNVTSFCEMFDVAGQLRAKSDPVKNWKSIDLLFQLTSSDIAKGSANQLELLDLGVQQADLRKIDSYLFFALELNQLPEGALRTRTNLCEIARAVNRLFSMPALVLFKEGDKLSIAITYRRGNKKDHTKDVVERKVTLIKDISIVSPHPGHLAIIADFALPSLSAFRGRDIRTFADLDNAWRESLSVELLRRRAYRMLSDWYFWAREIATFPPDAKPDAQGKPSLHLIRMLTRIIFCWFVKEKRLPNNQPLIPHELFDVPRIKELLKDVSPDACTYYTAILQNLFFATLNTEMDPPGKPAIRRFVREGNPDDHMVHTLWRHKKQLRDPEMLTNLFRSIPFLNGGLFECLDDRVEIEEGSSKTKEIRIDGFSVNESKQPRIPNRLFFGADQTADLSSVTGNSSRTNVSVTPLLAILNSFVWTITENTPLEEEVALDPDLLGNVFENLLASYNPETGTIARNATGSFYTPDYVVDWMIEKALEPILIKALPKKTKNVVERISRLLDWNELSHDFNASEAACLIDALSSLRTLDPACGSGAYPMGLLKKMVRVLSKLDPDNSRWRQKQIDIAEQLDSSTARDEALAAIKRAFSRNNDDYGRKLYLIENSIYGVDIQPLAVQIAKLRFFITLIVDQPIDPAQPNYGILPLPNLETKIVPANTLLGLQRGQLLLGSDDVRKYERGLKSVRHRYFTARRYPDKKALRALDRKLCKQLAKALVDSGECTTSDASRLVEWNPYNTNTYAGFFDPGWMFGLEGKDGETGKFDLVIGNPPYVRQEELKSQFVRDSAGIERPLKEVLKEQYECFTGTADLYVYFFERSLQLLHTGGILSFITSNKYFRAAYGEKLRTYLLTSTAPIAILDFGDANIFTAVAYPCIIVTEKLRDIEKGKLTPPETFNDEVRYTQLIPHIKHTFPVLAWRPGPSKADFPMIFDNENIGFRQRNLTPSGWRLEGSEGHNLLDRIRKSGIPLYECCKGRFYYGIKTGLNEAFVVDRATRDRLIEEHSSSSEVIKPYSRGRDVKRWTVNTTDLFLIFTRHGISIDNYPAIKRHLSKFKDKLMPGVKGGRKKGTYEWFEIQDNVAYWREFEKPKIITGRFMDKPTFAYDVNGVFHNNANSFIAEASPFLVGVLNSPVTWYFLRNTCTDLQNGFIQAQNENIGQIPIPFAAEDQKQLFERLVDILLVLHAPKMSKAENRGLMIAYFEQWLNGLVYELFFPGELHNRHLNLFDETARLLSKFGKREEATPVSLFADAYALNQPLRAMLADLQTIEQIRVIEDRKV